MNFLCFKDIGVCFCFVASQLSRRTKKNLSSLPTVRICAFWCEENPNTWFGLHHADTPTNIHTHQQSLFASASKLKISTLINITSKNPLSLKESIRQICISICDSSRMLLKSAQSLKKKKRMGDRSGQNFYQIASSEASFIDLHEIH